jgi:hypothetical protein
VLFEKANKNKEAERADGPNTHAFGTSVTHPACADCAPEASGYQSSATFGNIMNLSFDAPYVDYRNAMDWEIQQVVFDTTCDDTEDAEDIRKSPYVLISRNFESPGATTIEWHDGNDYDGGGSIRSASLEANRIKIILDGSRTIDITFNLNTNHFEELKKYLKNILGSRVKME